MRLWKACFLMFCLGFTALAKGPGGYQYYQKLTGDDSDTDKAHWDSIYARHNEYLFGRDPSPYLVNIYNELKIKKILQVGQALDIAMGEGRNAVFLAKKGFDVLGVDISDNAIRKAKRLAKESGVHIRTATADLNKYQIAPDSYDLIVVFLYVQRSLVSQLVRGLKPGGILVYEAHTTDQSKYGKDDKEILLGKGELESMFKARLKVIRYEERDTGTDAVARLVARKEPKSAAGGPAGSPLTAVGYK